MHQKDKNQVTTMPPRSPTISPDHSEIGNNVAPLNATFAPPRFLRRTTIDAVDPTTGYDYVIQYLPPSAATERDIKNANIWLRDRAAMLAPVTRKALHGWLLVLFNLTGKRSSDQDGIQARLAAYALFLDGQPAYKFTDGTLRYIAARNKFIPTAQELSEGLTKATAEIQSMIAAVKATVNAARRGPVPESYDSMVARERRENPARRLGAILAAKEAIYGNESPEAQRVREQLLKLSPESKAAKS